MSPDLVFRKANVGDLSAIVKLLIEDELGQARENAAPSGQLDTRYLDAFERIAGDANQYLMVAEMNGEIVATCHLTLMPSLTFTGATRMQIEAVRVAVGLRGEHIGEKMMREAIAWGEAQGASIIQLTTNKKRPRAKQFYQRLGFEASHEGMKLYL